MPNGFFCTTVNFIIIELKSKHLVCLSFLWWQVFLRKERKYFTHILGLSSLTGCAADILTTVWQHWQKWYFVFNTDLTYWKKKCSSDGEKLLKFLAEGQEFAKILRSLEQFICQWKVSTIFVTECFCNLFLEVSQIWYIIRTIQIQIEKKDWYSVTYRKS